MVVSRPPSARYAAPVKNDARERHGTSAADAGSRTRHHGDLAGKLRHLVAPFQGRGVSAVGHVDQADLGAAVEAAGKADVLVVGDKLRMPVLGLHGIGVRTERR